MKNEVGESPRAALQYHLLDLVKWTTSGTTGPTPRQSNCRDLPPLLVPLSLIFSRLPCPPHGVQTLAQSDVLGLSLGMFKGSAC